MELIRDVHIKESQVGLIGFAIKNRRLNFGYNAVRRSIMKGKTALVLVNKEISKHTLKKVIELAGQYKVPVYRIHGDANSLAAIRFDRYKILAVHRGNIAQGLLEYLN